MASWQAFQGPPSIQIDALGTADDWPETEQDEHYSADEPWRLQKYDPGLNGKGFEDEIVAQFEEVDLPKGLMRAAEKYSQLMRFADMRQTRLDETPDFFGSNLNVVLRTDGKDKRPILTIGSNDLRHMWKCYSDILCAIHREGQIKPGPAGTWIHEPLEELAEMMTVIPEKMMTIELERTTGRHINNVLLPGFEWLYPYGAHLDEMYATLHAIIAWAKETKQDPNPFVHLMAKRAPPMVRLLVTLKAREILFEEALGHEHFEDVLMDKRIWMIDPRDFYDFGHDWKIPARQWVTFLNSEVKPRLREFRTKLQDLFDYRLLVHWGYGRLWKKLYLVLNPTDKSEKEAIQEFSNFATKHSKLAFDLFEIHPLDLSEIKPDPCSVCLCAFEHNEVVMETHCNHHYHPACLFTYWDDEHRFQNRCPECRTSQGILRDKVDFLAERDDICYEEDPDLSGLEEAYLEALQETVAAGEAFDDSAELMDLWCRVKMEKSLKEQRRVQKEQNPGWDDLK